MVYAPTELASAADKDVFYNQLEPLIQSTPPHDQLLVIGDLNAVSGIVRAGYERVVGNSGSGQPNDNSARLLNTCSLAKLSIVGSFRRKEIHRLTWLSNDGRTRKEIDHMLTRYLSLSSAPTGCTEGQRPQLKDHRLVVGVKIQVYHKPQKPA